jgi:excisionase family DNA binding protein
MKVIEPSTDEVMDYRGLSVYMKVAQGTLRHYVMNNQIPFYKVGTNVRFSKSKIDAWLAEHHREPKKAVMIRAQKENIGELFTAHEGSEAKGGGEAGSGGSAND